MQMGNTGTGSALTNFFHTELLLLSTKLLLIRWTENINQLTAICKSCTLIPRVYGGLPTSFPASWFIKASTCQEGQKSRLKLSVLHTTRHMTNYHGPAPHIPTARMSKREEKDYSQTFLTSENQDYTGAQHSTYV